jgi:hypothetical protein
MNPEREHLPLCTVELIAEGHADRCPGEDCAFWEQDCVLTRVQADLDARPAVARLLLELRRELEDGRAVPVADVRAQFERQLFP